MNEKRILLVDDDPDIHRSIRAILSRSGFTVESAFDGLEATAKLRSFHPDLIILDLLMPGKSGAEVYETLQNDPALSRHKDLPVIILTASDQPDQEVKRLIEMGLTAFLEKPFGYRELLNVIENAFIINESRVRQLHLRQAAETSKNFLENLVACCPVAIISTDEQDRISYVSGKTEELFEISQDEAYGTPVQEILQLESDAYLRIKEKTRTSWEPVSIEHMVQTASRPELPLKLTFARLQDDAARACGCLVLGLDLTDQKMLERERLERERLEAITESLATINHRINNPLTPLLGNLQLLQKDREQLPGKLQRRLDVIEANARRIYAIIQEFNRVATPIRTKYYGKANILELAS